MKNIILICASLFAFNAYANDKQCELDVNISVFQYTRDAKSIHQTDTIEHKVENAETSQECYEQALQLAETMVAIAYAERGSSHFGLIRYEDIPLHVWVSWKFGKYSWAGLRFNGDSGAVTRYTRDHVEEFEIGNLRFSENGEKWPEGK